MNPQDVLLPAERARLVAALRSIQEQVRWKPGKDLAHLSKRQRMGHLPFSDSVANYESVVLELVREGGNAVYLYEFGSDQYYAVRGTLSGQDWLVIFGQDGLLETAFPPEDMEDYLERRGFIPLANVKEVLQWTNVKS